MPKLVRDGIPGKIRANGEVPVTRVLGDAEFAEATRKKVAEEAGELAGARDCGEIISEAADVLEAFDAFLEAHCLSMAEVRTFQERRRAEMGGFSERVFLERVDHV